MKSASQLVENFLNLFQIQAKSIVKVFKYLHNLSNRWRSVFPGLERISRITEMSVRQVQRAIDKLVEMGWLCKMNRHRQSSLFFIPECLKKLKVCDKKTFENPEFQNSDFYRECHANVMPSIHSFFSKEKIDQTVDRFPKEKKCNVPHCIQLKELSEEAQQTLARNFSEFELADALNWVGMLIKRGEEIVNLGGLLFSSAKRVRVKMRGY